MTAMQRVFSETLISTHMPFFDGTALLFSHCAGTLQYEFDCGGTIWKSMRSNPALAARFSDLNRTQTVTYRPWKLACCVWTDKKIWPIATGLPAAAVECSPSMYQENGIVHVSFIAGVPGPRGLMYRLYKMSGPDLSHLGVATAVSSRPTWCGFVSSLHVCRGGGESLELTEKASGAAVRVKTSFQRILRATFAAEDAEKLVITGIDQDNSFRSIVYELASGTTSDLLADGHVYKSSIHADQIVFAQQRSQGSDDRDLYFGKYSLTRSSVSVEKQALSGTAVAAAH